jgi:hypothetical protein
MTTAAEIEQLVKNFSEWELGGGKFAGAGQQVDVLNSWRENSGAAFNLKNGVQVRYVGWEKQRFGLNLGYSDDATTDTAHKMARWFFRRQDGSSQTVRYGELIAMGYGTAPSFYKYAVTEVGINLENTGTPSYEWRLIGPQGTAGQPVKTGQWLAIWNEVEEGFLIYFNRDVGADFGWPDSKRWKEQLMDLAWEAAKEAAKTYIEAYAGGGAGTGSGTTAAQT